MWVKTHDRLVGELIMIMINQDKLAIPQDILNRAIAEFEKRNSTIH